MDTDDTDTCLKKEMKIWQLIVETTMQTTDYRRQKHMSFKKCYVSIVSTRKLLHDQNSKNVE